jgi:peroxiredoxin
MMTCGLTNSRWIRWGLAFSLCGMSVSALAVDVGTAKLDKAATAAKIGQPAPDFSIEWSSGKTSSLKDLLKDNSFVVLEWYNQDCPYVRKHYDTDNMQALQKKFTGQKVAWLSVVSSAPGKQGHLTTEGAQKQVKTGEKGFAATAMILDPSGTVGKSYGAKTTPHMYIVDKDLTLRYVGGIDGVPTTKKEDVKTDKTFFDQAMTTLLAGKTLTPEQASTKPYGCSVKY